MKTFATPVLFLVAGFLLLAGCCGNGTAEQTLKWPPDTLTAVHVGGNIYEISSGDSLAPARMRIAFVWPMPSDTSKLNRIMAMKVPPYTQGSTGSVAFKFPVPWPPDTPFYPSAFGLKADTITGR